MISLPCCKDNKATCSENPCNCDDGGTCPDFKGGCYLEAWQTLPVTNWYASVLTKDGSYFSIEELETVGLSENIVTCGIISIVFWDNCPPPANSDPNDPPVYTTCDKTGQYVVSGDIGSIFIDSFGINSGLLGSIDLSTICSLYAAPNPDPDTID